MTLNDIEKLPRELLLATDIAEYLGADPDTIRWQAKHEPEKLGFPVIVYGKMVRIPKEGFIYFCRYGRPCINTETRPETMQYYIELAMKSLLSKINDEGA